MNKDIEKELNEQVKCTLASSKIHGIGVMAIRDIKKGEELHCQSFERKYIQLDSLKGLRKEVLKLILQRWPIAEKRAPFFSPNDDARLISFMNHSNTPNYDKYTDKALCGISKGEEVTEDYES